MRDSLGMLARCPCRSLTTVVPYFSHLEISVRIRRKKDARLLQFNRAFVARSLTRQIFTEELEKLTNVVRRTQDTLKEHARTSRDWENSQLFVEFVDHVKNGLRSFYGLHISQDWRASVARIQQDFDHRLIVEACTMDCDLGLTRNHKKKKANFLQSVDRRICASDRQFSK